MTAGVCLSISVALHVIIAILVCVRMMMSTTILEVAQMPAEKEITIDIKLDAETSPRSLALEVPAEIPVPPKNAPLTAQELKALAKRRELIQKPELADKPKPKLKDLLQYARTADDQLAGKVTDTNLLGERDTIAASNADAVESAPDRISIKGGKPKIEGQIETVDTTFQDGILESMDKGSDGAEPSQQSQVKAKITPPAEISPNPDSMADLDQREQQSSVDPSKELGDALDKGELATSNKENKRFLETQNKIALNEEMRTSKNTGTRENKGIEEQKKTIANNAPDPNAIKQNTKDAKRKKQQSQIKKTANKSASKRSKKGFRSQAKATVMEGTISRRSKVASRNVKATPVGKYMAKISKLVEQEWQRRCMMHADLIQPGTLRIGFMVDERGKVKNIMTISQTLGSENQRSLTFQALTTVKIPPMPRNVREIQGGDPLEFRYYFSFQ